MLSMSNAGNSLRLMGGGVVGMRHEFFLMSLVGLTTSGLIILHLSQTWKASNDSGVHTAHSNIPSGRARYFHTNVPPQTSPRNPQLLDAINSRNTRQVDGGGRSDGAWTSRGEEFKLDLDHMPRFLELVRLALLNDSTSGARVEEMSQTENALLDALLEKERRIIYGNVIKNFTLAENDPRNSYVNLHRYRYILDSPACVGGGPKGVILVHSKFENYIKRAKIRATWARNSSVDGFELRTIFFLGEPSFEVKSKNRSQNSCAGTNGKKSEQTKHQRSRPVWSTDRSKVMRTLQLEARAFGDLVMGNFSDSYRNLTLKSTMTIGWVLSHCPNTWYVVKVDDDVMVNTFNVVKYMRDPARKTTDLLMCESSKYGRPIRCQDSKWFVSHDQYPFTFYPPYCLGLGAIMTRDVVEKLYAASRHTKSFWIDDVFLTGLAAMQAGVSITDLQGNYTSIINGNSNVYTSEHSRAMFVLATFNSTNSRQTYWRDLMAAIQHETKNT